MKPKWMTEAEAEIAMWAANREQLIQKLTSVLPAGHPLKPETNFANDRRACQESTCCTATARLATDREVFDALALEASNLEARIVEALDFDDEAA
jgi:hypothetical protein